MRDKSKPVWSRMGWVIAIVVVATSGAVAQTGAASGQRDLVLQGGTLIDGTGRAPIPDAVIVVEGNRIKAVGRRGQVAIPANANVINVTGRTILPGLIESHVHLQDWQLPMFLPYGITTIADINSDTTWILAQRDLLNSGKIKGPRMFVAGAFIEGPAAGIRGGGFNTRMSLTTEDARATARSRIAAGVDMLKVQNNLTDDQLRAVIEEANKAGMPVVGHTRNIRRAAELGDKHEEHMDTMARALLDPDEKWSPKYFQPTNGPISPPSYVPEAKIDPKTFPPLIAYLVKQGVFVNPTLAGDWSPDTPRFQEHIKAAQQFIHDPRLGFVPEAVKKVWAGPQRPSRDPSGVAYAHVAQFLKEYSAAGGKVIVGTDTGGDTNVARIPGVATHYEMQLMADLGIAPMKVIQGATLWNAQLLMKDKDLGSVEPGKLADIIAIDGNPLVDMGTTKNVRLVIKDGKVMDTSYDPNWRNPIPQPYGQYQGRATPPDIDDMTPRMAHQGDPTVALTVEGDRFTPSAVVQFDGTALPTKFVSNKKLTATIDAKLLQRKPGDYVLYVVDTGLLGTISQPAYFMVGLKK